MTDKIAELKELVAFAERVYPEILPRNWLSGVSLNMSGTFTLRVPSRSIRREYRTAQALRAALARVSP